MEDIKYSEDYESAPKNKRYCGNRLGFIQFALASSCLVFVILLAVLLPTLYFAIIPGMIKGSISGGDLIYVNSIVLGEVKDQSLQYKFDGGIKPGARASANITYLKSTIATSGNPSVVDIGITGGFNIERSKDNPIITAGEIRINDFQTTRKLINNQVAGNLALQASFCIWKFLCNLYLMKRLQGLYFQFKVTSR